MHEQSAPEGRDRQTGTVTLVALARRLYEAQRQRDNDTIFGLYDPEIEWDMSHYPHWLERTTYRGHAGVRAFMGAWLGLWASWEATIEDAVAAGERVLLVVADRARVRDSSAVIERRYGHMLTFRNGRIVHAALYHDVEEARRDLATGG